jgi:hypothetical protein
MKITANLTAEQVLDAATAVGLRATGQNSCYPPEELTEGRRADSQTVRLRLRARAGGPYRKQTLRRLSRDGRPKTIPGAVCYHGWDTFMREVFRRWPSALVEVGGRKFRSLADWEAFLGRYDSGREILGWYGFGLISEDDSTCVCREGA